MIKHCVIVQILPDLSIKKADDEHKQKMLRSVNDLFWFMADFEPDMSLIKVQIIILVESF